jgi:secondary thiamine-phosphate synthase enzyme
VNLILSLSRAGDISESFRPGFGGQEQRVETTTITVRTGSSEVVRDLTREASSFVADLGDGLLSVFVPHATAGVAVLELGAGSDDDLLAALGDLLPADNRWRHAHGSPGHGRSHVMPAIVPPSMTVPVIGGRLALGTWQSVALVDLNVDNTERTVRFTFLAG